MALQKIYYINPQCRIGLWRVQETIEELLDLTHRHQIDFELLKQYNSVGRKQEYLAVRALLLQLHPDAENKIIYNRYRKPYLENQERFVSISHSQNLIAIFTHDKKNVSIDIEFETAKITPIKFRLFSQKELDFSKTFTAVEDTLLWSMKESLYKYYGDKNLDFRKDLIIDPFTPRHRGNTSGVIQKGAYYQEVIIEYQIIQNMVLSFVAETK